jgi:hypothetical protein
MMRIIILSLLFLNLCSCAVFKPLPPGSPVRPTHITSEINQGKRYFNEGYYKRAMHNLLPLACDGYPEAQYAVGYMYYYGLGVAQDTFVGYFWIKRSADQQFYPAIQAQQLIDTGKNARA